MKMNFFFRMNEDWQRTLFEGYMKVLRAFPGTFNLLLQDFDLRHYCQETSVVILFRSQLKHLFRFRFSSLIHLISQTMMRWIGAKHMCRSLGSSLDDVRHTSDVSWHKMSVTVSISGLPIPEQCWALGLFRCLATGFWMHCTDLLYSVSLMSLNTCFHFMLFP